MKKFIERSSILNNQPSRNLLKSFDNVLNQQDMELKHNNSQKQRFNSVQNHRGRKRDNINSLSSLKKQSNIIVSSSMPIIEAMAMIDQNTFVQSDASFLPIYSKQNLHKEYKSDRQEYLQIQNNKLQQKLQDAFKQLSLMIKLNQQLSYQLTQKILQKRNDSINTNNANIEEVNTLIKLKESQKQSQNYLNLQISSLKQQNQKLQQQNQVLNTKIEKLIESMDSYYAQTYQYQISAEQKIQKLCQQCKEYQKLVQQLEQQLKTKQQIQFKITDQNCKFRNKIDHLNRQNQILNSSRQSWAQKIEENERQLVKIKDAYLNLEISERIRNNLIKKQNQEVQAISQIINSLQL